MKERAIVEKVCRKLMDSHGLDSWRLAFFDESRDYSGLCDSESRTIYIRTQCLDKAEDICLHEIAHALTGPYEGHGSEWASLAWRLAGSPAGGTGSCPEPRRMSDLIGSITYRSLLLDVLNEAKDIGIVDGECRMFTLLGENLSRAMKGFVFYFYVYCGDVHINTPFGCWYVDASELQPEIEAAYVAASGSERIAKEVKAVNDFIDGLQGAALRWGQRGHEG